MFIYANNTNEHLNLFRDVFGTYKKIIEAGLEAYGLSKDAVMLKNTSVKNPNRAPLIIIQRGEMPHTPRSLMLNEKQFYNQSTGMSEYTTEHIIDYPIEFVSYGNEYLEAERLGNLCIEALLTTGMSVVRHMHPNFLGAELVGWSRTDLIEGSDSSLVSNTVTGRVTLQIEGVYKLKTT